MLWRSTKWQQHLERFQKVRGPESHTEGRLLTTLSPSRTRSDMDTTNSRNLKLRNLLELRSHQLYLEFLTHALSQNHLKCWTFYNFSPTQTNEQNCFLGKKLNMFSCTESDATAKDLKDLQFGSPDSWVITITIKELVFKEVFYIIQS